jgi:hypothetical protein
MSALTVIKYMMKGFYWYWKGSSNVKEGAAGVTSLLTLIGPGEVKVDLANFDQKIAGNL